MSHCALQPQIQHLHSDHVSAKHLAGRSLLGLLPHRQERRARPRWHHHHHHPRPDHPHHWHCKQVSHNWNWTYVPKPGLLDAYVAMATNIQHSIDAFTRSNALRLTRFSGTPERSISHTLLTLIFVNKTLLPFLKIFSLLVNHSEERIRNKKILCCKFKISASF